MHITESDLASHRAAHGLAGRTLAFTGPKAFKAGTGLPEAFFSPTWDYFAGKLRCPAEAGGPGPMDVVLLLAFGFDVPVLPPGFDWLALLHQAGGYACEHPCFIGLQLQPRANVAGPLSDLARKYDFASMGHFYRGGIGPQEVAEYRRDLEALGVTCNGAISHLTESVYPIDATQANLDLLAENAPMVAAFTDDPNAARGDNFALFVIAQNSD